MEFNVENLFVLFDETPKQNPNKFTEDQWQKLTSSTVGNKSIQNVIGVAKAIKEVNPDIVALCEVGGKESIDNFNKYFLDDQYHTFLLEGNSDRGIDIAYLAKKTLNYKFDLISHKNRPLDFLYPHERQNRNSGYNDLNKVGSHRFSRDALELRMFEKDGDKKFIFLLVHLKSPLDPENIDPQGRDRRQAEFETLLKIFSELKQDHPETPIILCGDFNGVLSPTPDPEFVNFKTVPELHCALDLVQIDVAQRFTHMQFTPMTNSSKNRQIDYILLPTQLHDKIVKSKTNVYRYTDEFGMPLLIPKSLTEKRQLPSDHYPVVVTLEFPETKESK